MQLQIKIIIVIHAYGNLYNVRSQITDIIFSIKSVILLINNGIKGVDTEKVNGG